MTRKTGQNQSMAKSQYPQKKRQNPHQEKMRQNHHPEKNRFNRKNEMENRQKPVDGKSQGQIFQKSQGQSGFNRRKVENPKVKYFRNPKVKSQCPIGKCAKTTTQKKTGFNRRKVETTKWKIPRSHGQNRF